MLELKGVHTYYGLSHILFDVSLKVGSGEVVALLGRNGAGKSTTMRSIMGLTPPKRGSIVYKGQDITTLKPHLRARLGLGYVPDDRRVFADLTVGENLEIVARPGPGSDQWTKEKVYSFFPPLAEIDGRQAGFLSGGEQQMLTIGRALMTNPDFLLLDEPTEGLAPLVVRLLAQQIQSLKQTGLTVLLAEQNQDVALGLADRGYIIDNGVIRYSGTIEDLRADEEVRKRYLMV
ncbi:MAG: ABC transporter ATP-binding protein [Desulfarculaceae bacterium]|nr:ABC transporter ATP-binding protein [Desulfarculaceae bacterium]MCF8047999.1 ABC transporter ATP-binding protein [Desulfarculaceae bacterium]MCF8065901.1 ABC transporter ATP-binding protein [Desulfarculaceae bacterium]MCF8098060.1 ABC transporter ATP-binding protein [Desulfarculaceae bacterium]MCF8121019.1 ABC transporter ATP-binding protein [Desulfarculaceae bacterium]